MHRCRLFLTLALRIPRERLGKAGGLQKHRFSLTSGRAGEHEVTLCTQLPPDNRENHVMPIPIEQEPASHTARFQECEACCFCHQPTTYWTALPKRAAGAQVACCPGCADIFPAYLVPTKDEWCDYHAAQEKQS